MKSKSHPKSQITSKRYCQDINLVFEEDTQQYLLVMIEKWQQSLDKGAHYGALLKDLSKAFDCLSNDLPIAKLHTYGFEVAP